MVNLNEMNGEQGGRGEGRGEEDEVEKARLWPLPSTAFLLDSVSEQLLQQ
jgi:hypothetical protein